MPPRYVISCTKGVFHLNDERSVKLPHNVILEDRKNLSITGVNDVDSFDESNIVAYTDMGELSVKGSNLHITKLSIETGELEIKGEIVAVIYTNDNQKQGGFFSKVFR